MPIAQHFEEVAVRNFTPDEVARVKAVLTTVYSNLDEIEPEIEALGEQAPTRMRSVNKMTAQTAGVPQRRRAPGRRSDPAL